MKENRSEIIAGKINWNREITITFAAILFTAAALFFLWQDLYGLLSAKKETGEIRALWEQRAFITIVLGLIYGNIIYQLCRLGFLYRDKKQARQTGSDTSKLFSGYAPDVTILVPSYKEELKTIYQTLMSAALQQYPDKRVVLLLDDPPYPDNIHDKEMLDAARELTYEISNFLSDPWLRYYESREKCLRRLEKNITDLDDEVLALAACYENAAAVLGELAASYAVTDHTDYLFVQKILRDPAKNFRRIARSLKNRAAFPSTCPGIEEILNKYNLLTGTFSADISFFERKRYENLSHEKNKAMNLNSYIGLIGKDFHEETKGGRHYLRECPTAFSNFSVPDADFILTLDADSLVLPEYTARLVDVMMRPENEKLAVVQTPYSAIPGTDNVLERVAGATTDIQLLIHQGFTAYGATYWVGANALLRRTALEDIKVIENEGGYPVARYIQDRTVIEDTESSIDLIDAGWSLLNYPARLTYSATPADYGSLLIQRRRWANGGLIILPMLLRHIARNIGLKKMAEAFIRIHYLLSIALSSVGVLLLILYPFDQVMKTMWLPLTALPYFYLYARDLKLSGYGWRDLFRVYALNLMLIPVNLGGVFKSLQQGMTKKKIDFCRTPKLAGRTAAPPFYLLATFALFAYCLISFPVDVSAGRYMHGAFAGINAAFFGYACTYFIGWRAGAQNITVAFTRKTPEKPVIVTENTDAPAPAFSKYDQDYIMRENKSDHKSVRESLIDD